MSSLQVNHTPHYELGADVQWPSADIISLFGSNSKSSFVCVFVSVDVKVLGAAKINSQYIQLLQ